MSVLYKALQKAEKENEARQSASSESGFDPQRLAASGALKFAGGGGRTLNRVVMGVIILVAVAGGVGFTLFKDQLLPMMDAQVASAPPAAPATPIAQPAAESVLQPPPASTAPAATPALAEGAAPSQSVAAAPTETTPAASTTPAEGAPAETQAAAAPLPAAQSAESAKLEATRPEAAKPATRPARQEQGMPTLAANSPARMLSPPISISRSEFALAGVGEQVQVRDVSQAARSNVSSGYEALIRGSYDTALGFYDAALAEEPNSVLALLGRGTALQKLGRGQEAQAAYDSVLKLDPENREALTNITSIVGERSPQEALARLLELERQYATFSPIKAQIGLSYAKVGSMPQALDYFRRAVTLSPETVMYHYNMALVLDHMGRRDQAIASYERVLASISGGRGPTELSPGEIERRVRFLRAR